MSKKTTAKNLVNKIKEELTNQKAFNLASFVESPAVSPIDFTLSGFLKLEEIKAALEPFAKKIKQIEINFLKNDELDALTKERIDSIKKFIVCGEDGEPLRNATGGFTQLEGKEDEINAALEPTNKKHAELQAKTNAQRSEWNEFFVNGIADVDFPLLGKDDLTLPQKTNGATWAALKSIAPSLFAKK